MFAFQVERKDGARKNGSVVHGPDRDENSVLCVVVMWEDDWCFTEEPIHALKAVPNPDLMEQRGLADVSAFPTPDTIN